MFHDAKVNAILWHFYPKSPAKAEADDTLVLHFRNIRRKLFINYMRKDVFCFSSVLLLSLKGHKEATIYDFFSDLLKLYGTLKDKKD